MEFGAALNTVARTCFGLQRIVLAGATAAACLLAGYANTAHAASTLSETTDPIPQFDGVVNTAIEHDGKLYVGGSFSNAGAVDKPSAQKLSLPGLTPFAQSLPDLDGSVKIIKPDGSGGWFLFGQFQTANMLQAQRMLHMNAFGVVSDGWRHTINGTIRDVAITQDSVFISGDFALIDGQQRHRIAKFSRPSGALDAWAPTVNNAINDIDVEGSYLYAGGQFTKINGLNRPYLAKIHTTTAASVSPAASPEIVTAVKAHSGKLYAGANSANFSINQSGASKLDATTGVYVPGIPTVAGNTWAVEDDGNGGWFLGGVFTAVGDTNVTNLAHVLPDGSVDTDFLPNPNNAIYTLKRVGNTLYAGGNFTSIGGSARNRIAAFDINTKALTAWNPAPNNTNVFALAYDGSVLYVGGDFTSIGGQARNRIAALSTVTGLATAWNPNASTASTHVRTLTLDGTTLYVGGTFTTIGGQARNRAAAISTATGLATAWNPNVNQRVRTIVVSPGGIYLGGDFTTIGGITRNRAGLVDAANGALQAWNPNFDNSVYSMMLQGTTLYAGGGFYQVGSNTRQGVAAFDTTTGSLTGWNPELRRASYLTTTIYTLGLANGSLYVGGEFTGANASIRKGLVRYDATTMTVDAWDPQINGTVTEMEAIGTTLYAFGEFNSVGTTHQGKFAAIDTSTAASLPMQTNFGGIFPSVDNITAIDNKLYLTGTFPVTGSAPPSHSMAFSTGAGPVPQIPPVDGELHAIISDGAGGYYVGGNFNLIGGVPKRGIARVLSDGTVDTGFSADITSTNTSVYQGPVSALSLAGGHLYVGGDYTAIGGIARKNLSRLNPSTGAVDAWDPTPSDDVFALDADATNVYVGGAFLSIGGSARNRIAAFTMSTGALTAWNPNASSSVTDIEVAGTSIYAGGSFSSIGGQARNGVAELSAAGTATAWNPNIVGGVNAIDVTATMVWAVGNLSSAGGQVRSRGAGVLRTTGAPVAWDPQLGNTTFKVEEVDGHVYTCGLSTTTSATGYLGLKRFDAGTGAHDAAWQPTNDTACLTLMGTSGAIINSPYRADIPGATSRETDDDSGLLVLNASDGSLVSDANLGDWSAGSVTSTSAILIKGNSQPWVIKSPVTRNRLAAIDLNTNSLDTWNPDVSGGNVVDMILRSNTLYLSGTFTAINGQPRSGLAAFDLTTGALLPWAPVVTGGINCMDLEGNLLYVGGSLTNIDGTARTRAAAIDLDTNTVTGWNPAPDGTVEDIDATATNVFIVGQFNNAGGQARQYLAGLNTTTGAATAFANPSLADNPDYVFVHNGKVYAIGYIGSVGVTPRFGAAIFDANTGALDPTELMPQTINGSSYFPWYEGASIYDGKLYLSFTSSVVNAPAQHPIGGAADRKIAEIDLTTNLATSWAPATDDDGYVTAGSWGVLVSDTYMSGAGRPGSTKLLRRTQIPTPSVQTGPLPAAVTGDETPTLTATFEDGDATDLGAVEFQVCANSTCTDPSDPVEEGRVGGTLTPGGSATWQPSNDLSDGDWFWRSRGRDSHWVAGDWSATRSLTVDATAPLAPSISSTDLPVSTWTRTPSGTVAWTTPTDATGITAFSHSWTQSPTTDPGTVSTTTGTSSALPSGDGTWYLHVRGVDAADNWSQPRHLGPFLIDGTAPAPATPTPSGNTVVASWTNSRRFNVSLDGASDSGSGVQGHSLEWTQTPNTTPDTTQDTTTNTHQSPELTEGTWYLHTRTTDTAGNWSQPRHLGPFLLDKTKPKLAGWGSSAIQRRFESAPSFQVKTLVSDPMSGIASATLQVAESRATDATPANWTSVKQLAEFDTSQINGSNGMTYCVRVLIVDRAGNENIEPIGCTTILSVLHQFSSTGSWTGFSGSFWTGGEPSTGKPGSLASLKAETDLFVVVAQRCPTCGTLNAKIDGGKTVKINLRTRKKVESRRYRLMKWDKPGNHEVKIRVSGGPATILGIHTRR